jgi:hypothetical protein
MLAALSISFIAGLSRLGCEMTCSGNCFAEGSGDANDDNRIPRVSGSSWEDVKSTAPWCKVVLAVRIQRLKSDCWPTYLRLLPLSGLRSAYLDGCETQHEDRVAGGVFALVEEARYRN